MNGFSQIHQSTSSGGEYLKGQSGNMSITIGQPIIQTVRNNQTIATQGFQQPNCNLNLEFPEVAPLCKNEPVISLQATPGGGNFTGIGVSGNQFDPATADTGLHRIQYTLEEKGCIDSAEVFIRVKPTPLVTFTLQDSLCASSSSIKLDQVSPIGGVFNGLGVTNNSFNPASSGIGSHIITYTYTDPTTQCFEADTASIYVKPKPQVTLSGLPILCPDQDTLLLSFGNPSGGSYSGIGVYGNTFLQDSVNTSLVQITYSYFDSTSNCAGTATGSIIIDSLPSLSVSQAPLFCSNDLPSFLNTGFPFGGYYEGLGSALDTFGLVNPQQLSSGTFAYRYAFTSAYGCVAKVEDSLTVVSPPSVQLAAAPSLCLGDTLHTFSGGLPVGGSYFGLGITNNAIDLSVQQPGVYSLGYSFTDTNNCTGFDTVAFSLHQPTPIQTVFPNSICEDADSLFLNQYASPFGIAFSGTGVGNNSFWSGAGLANQTLSLQLLYADSNGCVSQDSVQFKVKPSPAVNLNLPSFCDNQSNVKLTGGLPKGGVYSGQGVDSLGFFHVSSVSNSIISYHFTDASGCTGETSVNAQINNAPQPNITNIPAFCENENAVTLSAQPNGGTFSGIGVLGASLNTTLLHDTVATVYYQLTDTNSCTGYDTLISPVISAPQINQPLHRRLCEEDPLVYQLPVGYTYEWDNGAFGHRHQRILSTDTEIWVEASNGTCKERFYGSITVNANPSISFTAFEPDCNDINGELSVSVQGESPYTYQWNSGHQTAFADNLPAGMYEITVTDQNGCSKSASTLLPNSNAPSLLVNQTPPSCFESTDGFIDVSLPIGYEEYVWYDGNKGLTRNNLSAGYYLIQATSQEGCVAGATVVLPAPKPLQVSFEKTPASCAADGSLKALGNGGVGGYSYVWSSGETVDSIFNKTAGVYAVTLSDANNCSFTAHTNLKSDEPFYVQLENIQLPFCNGTTSPLNLSSFGPNYQVLWSNGDTSLSSSAEFGVSNVLLSDGGCTQSLAFELPYANEPSPSICVVNTDTLDNALNITFENSGNLYKLYRRNNGLNAATLIASDSGIGSITIQDTAILTPYWVHKYFLSQENNCGEEYFSPPSSSIWLAGVSIGGIRKLVWMQEMTSLEKVFLYGNNVSGPVTLIDSVDASQGSIDLDTSQVFDRYWVRAEKTDSCGINEQLSNVVTTFFTGTPIYVETQGFENSFFLYPNPARTTATLLFSNELTTPLTITITDANGKVVYDQMIKEVDGRELILPVNNLAVGTYTVTLQLEKQKESLPLMVN